MSFHFRAATRRDIPALRELWKEAFGDSDAYLDTFYDLGFGTHRCRLALEGEELLGALYWFPCSCRGQEMAYIYAVATYVKARGRGVATTLLQDTWSHLESQGCHATILVPGTGDLVRFYAKMGYRPCSPQGRLRAQAQGPACVLKAVSPRRYGELRRAMLPPDAVVQEDCNLDFLATQAKLYAGKDLLLAALPREDGTLLALELLSRDPVKLAPAILKTLGYREGIFRVPYEKGRPFALFKPLSGWEGEAPGYFAFAFE